MAFWNKKPQEVVRQLITEPEKINKEYEAMDGQFSSAFTPIKSGDIALPYIEQMNTTSGGAIMFGNDNLFPQLLDQLYYAGVLNGAILDFKQLCTVGAGFEFVDYEKMTSEMKMRVWKFIATVDLEQLVENIAFDLFTHERSHVKIFFDEKGKPTDVKYIRAQKVRKDKEGNYVICDDWKFSRNVEKLPRFGMFERAPKMILEESKLGNNDTYAIPHYVSANNWTALEYESSILHKQNIYEGIFPSYMLKFPKKPESEKEKNELKALIEGAKGSRNSSRILTFFANSKDLLPELDAVPQIQTDKIFLQTDERTDSKICQAHLIDPIIMGIRVSGKLGSGTEIEKSIAIFQRINVVPKKLQVERMINKLLYVFDLGEVKFKLKEFSIIDSVNQVK